MNQPELQNQTDAIRQYCLALLEAPLATLSQTSPNALARLYERADQTWMPEWPDLVHEGTLRGLCRPLDDQHDICDYGLLAEAFLPPPRRRSGQAACA